MTRKLNVLFAASVAAVLSASAETIIWTGASGDYSWQTAENWSPAQVPTAADDVWLGTAEHTTGVYAQPILLGGTAACNSLNFYQDAAITVGAAGETLTVASGAVTMNNDSVATANEYLIACDVILSSEKSVWGIRRSSADPVGHLRVTGSVVANGGTGALAFKSSNGYRRGVVCFESTVSCAQPVEIDLCYIQLTTKSLEEIFGDDVSIKFTNNGGGLIFSQTDTDNIVFRTPVDMSTVKGSNRQDLGMGYVHFVSHYKKLTIDTPLEVPSKVELCFGSVASVLFDLLSTVSGEGTLAVNRTAVLVHSAKQLQSSLRLYSIGGGLLVDGTTGEMTGEAFVAQFANGGRYDYATPHTWGCYDLSGTPGGGFAAHGAPFVIPAAEGSEKWFGAQPYLQLGLMQYTDALAQSLTDHPVVLETPIELTKELRIQSGIPTVTGAIYVRPVDRAKINRLSGDLYGAGSLESSGYLNAELMIDGVSRWTGSMGRNALYGWDPSKGSIANVAIQTGPGGLSVVGSSPGCNSTVVFGKPSALPHGNDGQTAYLLSMTRYTARTGYLLNASAGGYAYDLAPGMKFLLSQGTGNKPDISYLGSIGDPGEVATLSGDVLVTRLQPGADMCFNFMAVGGSEFRLGTAEKPLNLIKVSGGDLDNASKGVDAPATPMIPDPDGTVSIYTLGGGTIVPENVAYDDASRYRWYIGEDGLLDRNHIEYTLGWTGTRIYTTFHGALRTTAAGEPGSVLGFPIVGLGGSLELENIDSIDFTTKANPAESGEVRMTGGLGFAARGTNDVHVTVNGTAGILLHNTAEGHPYANAGLIFGSRTANRTVDFDSPVNLNAGNDDRSFYVVGGTDPDRPVVRLNGTISSGALCLKGMKAADNATLMPTGLVELANADTLLASLKVYPGAILDVSCNLKATVSGGGTLTAQGGELRVTGSLPLVRSHVTSGAQNSPTTGGILSGTGTIDSHVIIYGGAELRPGLEGEGMLTFNRNLQFYNDAKLVIGGSQPTVAVGGSFYMADRATVKLDGECYGRKKLVSWAGSLGYVDGGSAATSDCSQWTVEGVKDPSAYSFEVDTTNKCIWMKGPKRGMVIILR